MINAKQEFLEDIDGFTVVAADISFDEDYDKSISIRLKFGYTQADYEYFLNQLDFEYDNGFGCQMLFGTIWLAENCWLDRYEYDGSESWELNSRPKLPDYLK